MNVKTQRSLQLRSERRRIWAVHHTPCPVTIPLFVSVLSSQAPGAAVGCPVRGGHVGRAQPLSEDERGHCGGAETLAQDLTGAGSSVQPKVSNGERGT